MRIKLLGVLGLLAAAGIGCQTPPKDVRVNTDWVPGVTIQQVGTRRTAEGFMQVQATGYNAAFEVRQFEYRVEWLDADGFVIPSKTGVWQPISAGPRSQFFVQSISPRTDALDFRINTRPAQ